MGGFRQLLSLAVDHAFFAPRHCGTLQFQPDAATAVALASTGCLFRQLDTGFELCHYQSATAALQLQLTQAQPWRLTFFGRSSDLHFVNYTDGLTGRDHPLCFRSDDVNHAPGAARQLRAETPGLQQYTWPRGPLPLCALSLDVGANILDNAPLQYQLSFAARATHWKYYFTGDWPSQPLRVVDGVGLLQFDAARTEQLHDGRSAQVIVSSTPIALQERPQQRLTLRTAQGAVDKILIKRLPLASPARLARESIANVPTWVSEIYVAS